MRIIDIVRLIRSNGGIPTSVKYRPGKHMYYNIIEYIEQTYYINHRQAMDCAKYFMY